MVQMTFMRTGSIAHKRETYCAGTLHRPSEDIHLPGEYHRPILGLLGDGYAGSCIQGLKPQAELRRTMRHRSLSWPPTQEAAGICAGM